MSKNRKNLVSVSSLGDKKKSREWKKSRSSRLEVFCQNGLLKNSQNSQESTCTGFFFIRVRDLSCFHVNSAKFLRTPILKNKVNGCFINHVDYWTQLNNFPNSNLMTSLIFAHKIGSAYTVKILSLIRSSRPEVLRSGILLKKRI